jgi:hypothetical protein
MEDMTDLLYFKELYEPLWEELYRETKRQGLKIRSIWMSDIAWQGKSGILNADKLGNDRTFSLADHQSLLAFILT